MCVDVCVCVVWWGALDGVTLGEGVCVGGVGRPATDAQPENAIHTSVCKCHTCVTHLYHMCHTCVTHLGHTCVSHPQLAAGCFLGEADHAQV